MLALRRTRLTGRGLGLVTTGGAAVVAGTLLGVVVLAQVGALLVLCVLGGVSWVALEVASEHHGRLRTVRRVPRWVEVGVPAPVLVEVTATGRRRLDRLQVAERASAELSGGGDLRATVRRSAGRLTLRYTVQGRRRGRWPLGPLEVRRTDPFGVARWHGPLGHPAAVAVRPVVVALDRTAWSASAEQDTVAAGSRRPATDDAALREYRAGDDLRRVHWASSARRGALVVRQDERAGHRPVTVVLELSPDDAVTEWTISAGASLATAMAEAGRPVRLLAGGRRSDGDLDDLLDLTVDLHRPSDPTTAAAWLTAATDHLVGGLSVGLVVAVIGPQAPPALTRLAAGTGWALVRGDPLDETSAPRTVEALHRAGWVAAVVPPGETVGAAWLRLERLLGPGSSR